MKTKNLFFMIGLVILGGISKGNAQDTWPFNLRLGNQISTYNLRGNPAPYNTAIGANVLSSGSLPVPTTLFTGGYNTGVGGCALLSTTSGSHNTSIGYRSLTSNTTGRDNVVVGYDAMRYNLSGNGNVAIGGSALTFSVATNPDPNSDTALNPGGFNTALGFLSGRSCTTGSNNVFVGAYSGTSLTTGGGNVFIGRVTVDAAATTPTTVGNNASNTIILADGAGTQRLLINGVNGYAGIGLLPNQIPQNRLELNSAGAVSGTLGLKFRGINNIGKFNTTATSNRRVLSVDDDGDVILVDDVGTGTGTVFTSTCGTLGFIPRSTGASSQSCSQIFDNGVASVGIGYATAAAANAAFPTVPGAWSSTTGTLYSTYTNYRLAVNGITRADGYLATSDKKFKKDIKPIEKALETIQLLEGKTYLWDREKNKEMNFDGGGHSGFIAQELEKVLPHLVATGENGEKAVNYMELMPYLVEAIKEQQTQINDLKAQISDNFKAQNQELIGLTNTKIISVSPNPSKDLITISFNIEKSVQNASIQVFDLNGTMMSNLKVNDRDNNLTRTIQKDNFGRGIYVVSLVINGKSIDTKKIIFE
jgi:hypothetical protein